jgi:hypothetical protein
MRHTRHRRKANKTQHGMEHSESLTTWDTQDIGGRQTKHNTKWNIQSPWQHGTHKTQEEGKQYTTRNETSSHWQHGTHKTLEEGKQCTTRNGTSRVTDNMGHKKRRRKANNTQHGM